MKWMKDFDIRKLSLTNKILATFYILLAYNIITFVQKLIHKPFDVVSGSVNTFTTTNLGRS